MIFYYKVHHKNIPIPYSKSFMKLIKPMLESNDPQGKTHETAIDNLLLPPLKEFVNQELLLGVIPKKDFSVSSRRMSKSPRRYKLLKLSIERLLSIPALNPCLNPEHPRLKTHETAIESIMLQHYHH